MPKQNLPLRENYFQCQTLPEKDQARLIRLGSTSFKELIFYSRLMNGPLQWIPISEVTSLPSLLPVQNTLAYNTIQLYQAADPIEPEIASPHLLGVTRIHSTLTQMIELVRNKQVGDPMKEIYDRTLGKEIEDQIILYDLVPPTMENPTHYIGVKWRAFKLPYPFAAKRDCCLLECQDEFYDASNNRKGWAISFHSIKLPCCPSLEKTHGLVRATVFRLGYVFVESEEKGSLDVFHTLQMDIKGHTPSWVLPLMMKKHINNIREVNRYFQEMRLTKENLLGDLELPSTHGVSRCHLCSKKFILLQGKFPCRKCGKVCCRSCSSYWKLNVSTNRKKKLRICTLCSYHASLAIPEDTNEASQRSEVSSYPGEQQKALTWEGSRISEKLTRSSAMPRGSQSSNASAIQNSRFSIYSDRKSKDQVFDCEKRATGRSRFSLGYPYSAAYALGSSNASVPVNHTENSMYYRDTNSEDDVLGSIYIKNDAAKDHFNHSVRNGSESNSSTESKQGRVSNPLKRRLEDSDSEQSESQDRNSEAFYHSVGDNLFMPTQQSKERSSSNSRKPCFKPPQVSDAVRKSTPSCPEVRFCQPQNKYIDHRNLSRSKLNAKLKQTRSYPTNGTQKTDTIGKHQVINAPSNQETHDSLSKTKSWVSDSSINTGNRLSNSSSDFDYDLDLIKLSVKEGRNSSNYGSLTLSDIGSLDSCHNRSSVTSHRMSMGSSFRKSEKSVNENLSNIAEGEALR